MFNTEFRGKWGKKVLCAAAGRSIEATSATTSDTIEVTENTIEVAEYTVKLPLNGTV